MTRSILHRRQFLGFLKILGFGVLPRMALSASTKFSLTMTYRDGQIFDCGAARGQNCAQVPLVGHAAPGMQIEARFLDAYGGTSPWQKIAYADETGAWFGTLSPLSRTSDWVRPQVRQVAQPSLVLTGQRCAAGHVIAIWGQSEFHRAVLPAHAALSSAPTVRDPEALQVSFSLSAKDDYGSASQFVHTAISDMTPVSAHMAALSNLLSDVAPAEHFHLIFHTRSGTGLQQLLDDSMPGREWEDDLKLQAFALAQHARPGLAWMSWYNSDAALGANYGRVLFAALTGRNADGSSLTAGAVPQGGQRPMDHCFNEIYGQETQWAIAGPHRFEMKNFTASIAACRAAVDRMFDNPHLPETVQRALEPLTYLNGNPNWKGDYSHPDTLEAPEDGMIRLMLLMGTSILRQLHLVDWPLPTFDQANLHNEGRVIEVWSSAGPVTTTRIARAEPRPASLPAVAGFALDGVPAQHVALVNGRVQIRADANETAFPKGTRLTFGAGGIGASDLKHDTRILQVWRDYPIVDVGQIGLEGLPVKAQTPKSILDLIPPQDRVSDPPLPGNILPPEISSFSASSRGSGWLKTADGWTLDASQATATAEAEARGAIQAVSKRGGLSKLAGKILELCFVPDCDGSDTEFLQIVIRATGGGATDLLKAEVRLTPRRRMRLALAPVPKNRDTLTLTFRRRGMPTGKLTIGGLGLYHMQG